MFLYLPNLLTMCIFVSTKFTNNDANEIFSANEIASTLAWIACNAWCWCFSMWIRSKENSLNYIPQIEFHHLTWLSFMKFFMMRRDHKSLTRSVLSLFFLEPTWSSVKNKIPLCVCLSFENLICGKSIVSNLTLSVLNICDERFIICGVSQRLHVYLSFILFFYYTFYVGNFAYSSSGSSYINPFVS